MRGLEVLTRLATVPDMDAIMAMLPPRPHRIISFATACAAMKVPVMLTWKDCQHDIQDETFDPPYLKHRIRIFSSVLQRSGLLLDTGRGNQAIELALRIADILHDLVQCRDIPHIDLPVVERVSYVNQSAHSHFTVGTGLDSPSSSAALFCTR